MSTSLGGESKNYSGLTPPVLLIIQLFRPPLLVLTPLLVTGSTRLSILSLLVLFIAGALLLARVDEAEGRRMAREL